MNKAQFQITRNCATLLLPNDYGGADADQIRSELLHSLHQQQNIQAIIFDCTNLELIDQQDLNQLLNTIRCIQFMGKQIGFCSVGASLAAVLVNLSVDMKDCCFGLDLDDAINRLSSSCANAFN